MKKLLYLFLSISLFISCSKDPVNQPPFPSPVDDVRTVLLKEVVAEKLPDPYYKFVYDANKYVTQVSFASGLSVYNVEYENKRVKKLINIKNGQELLYNYTGTHVTKIDQFEPNQVKVFSYELEYNDAGKLTQLVWKEFFDDPAGIVIRKALLKYHADGNLATLKKYNLSDGALLLTSTRQFEEYDNKSNVDDFYLLIDFFDSFLFLPQVKLQANNPGKEIITGDMNDFDISYTYEFINSFPVKKTVDIRQTKGDHTGQSKRFTNRFTYY